MTLCNVCPFGHIDDNSLTYSDYMAEMTAKKKQWPYERMRSVVSNLSVKEYDDIWRDLYSHVGFVTNLMPNSTSQLQAAHSQELIVDCFLFNKELSKIPVNCTNILHFHWDQSYQKCYTIRVPHTLTTVGLLLSNICLVCGIVRSFNMFY